ncbi:MAG: hypothetical protein H7A05_02905 [Pseudomonadales bacterium]|nr:methylamine utilization protein [Pseudomonadales bacterium]MCP5331084.1 hypothetical protein [Pseudomonadales bacterium]MCP5343547.1 hypothetical protein [Pseudomonadales bacterium]
MGARFALLLFGGMTVFSVQAAELRIALQDADSGAGVQGAVVEVLLPAAQQAAYALSTTVSVDQVDKEFVPNVTVIGVGSRVNFPNSDAILHHVYSFSPAKVFELPLYGQGQNLDYFETFEQAGVVELGCNIHDWMLAYIYVAQTRLAVATDEQGRAQLVDVPEGEYTVRVWHPRAASEGNVMEQKLVFRNSESGNLRLALTLERDNRLRRSPKVSRTRYR